MRRSEPSLLLMTTCLAVVTLGSSIFGLYHANLAFFPSLSIIAEDNYLDAPHTVPKYKMVRTKTLFRTESITKFHSDFVFSSLAPLYKYSVSSEEKFSVFNDEQTMFEFSNLFVTENCAISNGTHQFISRANTQRLNNLDPSRFIGSFYNVVAVCHSATFLFGHFITDTLPFVAQLPEQFLKEARIVTFRYGRFMNDLLDAFGMNSRNLVPLRGKEYLFAQRVYTFLPLPSDSRTINFILRMRRRIMASWELNEKDPKKFIILRREEKKRRMINFDEIYSNFTASYPMYEWEHVSTSNFTSLRESAKYYNKVKLMYTIAGSNTANTLFMPSGGMLCELHPAKFIPNFLYWNACFGITTVYANVENMLQHKDMDSNISLTLAFGVLRRGIELLENNK